MKNAKRIICVVISIIMLFSLAACSDSNRDSNKDKKGPNKNTDALNNNLSIGQVVTKEGVGQFYIDYCQITSRVNPPVIDGAYSYYEAESGKVYVDVCLYYKNLSTEAVNVDDLIEEKLTYAGSYEYTGFEVGEYDNRGSFRSYADFDPLSQEYMHILIQVPEEVGTSSETLVLDFEYQGTNYTFDVRNNITGQTSTSVTLPSVNTSTTPTVPGNNNSVPTVQAHQITNNQLITHGGQCEFYAEYCQISDRVNPPVTDGAYSYYAAESGKVYVDLCLSYKNLSTTAVDVDDITSVSLTYDGSYKYTGFEVAEQDNRSDFTSYVDFDPLTTEYMHLLVQVPAEVQTSGKSVELFFTIAGTNYCYKVR